VVGQVHNLHRRFGASVEKTQTFERLCRQCGKNFLPLSRLWLAKSCAEKILVNEILKRWVSTEIASFAMISSIVAS
jgi:hypothetical protein